MNATKPPTFDCPRLHVITDTQCQSTFTHIALGKAAIAGGARLIQYRDKTELSARKRLDTAKRLAIECREAGAQLIVNDRADIAALCPGSGLHIGPTDLKVGDARALVGTKAIIGATINTEMHASALVETRPAYVGIGPFRASANKDGASVGLGLEGMRNLLTKTQASLGKELPCIAIGGIEVDDVASLLGIGFHGVAVIGAIARARSPEDATRSFLQAIDHAL